MYKDRSQVKTEQVKTLFTVENKKMFELLAEWRGTHTSTLVAEYAIKGAKRDIKEDPQLQQRIESLFAH
ncbi:MAG: hypothetical protein CSB48_02830 [Proteobacteria bacterium]|nr:MAG: hypothetical protein CSB48_02830 [Pseudomonadota bacterium]